MSTLLIIDGNNLAHKCRHVFSLSLSNGMDCSVTYGFLKVMWSYITTNKATSCVVCWDGGIPRYRREHFQGYKANRKHDEDGSYEDFLRQLRELNAILQHTGVCSVRRRYIEADDLMYHAAFYGHENYQTVAIASSDDDMYQAVNIAPNVYIWEPNKKVLQGAAFVEEEFGIPSTSYTHWKALQGDSSDNIDGVPGIGPKTATKLFQQYGSLSGIMNAALGANPKGKLEGKTAERIVEFGTHRLSRNVYIMALAFDRCGARLTLLDAVERYRAASISKLKEYLYRNAFVSLMQPTFYSALRTLERPVLGRAVLDRTPVVVHYREAMA